MTLYPGRYLVEYGAILHVYDSFQCSVMNRSIIISFMIWQNFLSWGLEIIHILRFPCTYYLAPAVNWRWMPGPRHCFHHYYYYIIQLNLKYFYYNYFMFSLLLQYSHHHNYCIICTHSNTIPNYLQ